MALLELDGIGRSYRSLGREVWAVEHVDLSVADGEIVCLVGESGCGKTTTGKIAAGLIPPSRGEVRYGGKNIGRLEGREKLDFRLGVQIVHQDPYASLNPVRTIAQTLSAPLLQHGFARTRAEARRRAEELMEIVDLTPPQEFLDKYPHQLSGGQRQRVSVARALTVKPRFIVADEAVSMVDVSIRASLLTMLARLNRELGVSFIFITHDLALAKYFAWEGRIAVMYLGRVVEIARTPLLVSQPSHPYTQALLSAIPDADPELTRSRQRIQLRSHDVPSLHNLPPGCRFHPRCPIWKQGLCDSVDPDLILVEPGRDVACHVVARQRLGSHVS